MIVAFLPFESGLAIFWFWLTALLALVWLKRHLDINQALRDPVLERFTAPATDTASPKVSVLVAAKDEQANIARCLDGLLKQQYGDYEVIVINDRSVDQTGEILDDYAARHDRMRALHVDHLPDGWFGKNNAMRVGVEQAAGEWLLFTDADCNFHADDLITRGVAFARQANVEFLSVLPLLEAGTFWEHVVQPVAGAILVIWNPPKRVNNPDSSAAYANGAFMLMTRAAYERIGGHAAVKATLNEDMHFARRAKRERVPFQVVQGGSLYSVRMYTSLKAIWRGWSRIFYGCFGSFPRLVASLLLLLIASLSPYVTFVGGLIAGGSAGGVFAGIAAVTIVAQQSVLWRYYRLAGQHPATALTYPLGSALCVGILLNAMTRAFGVKTTWRGTAYQRGN